MVNMSTQLTQQIKATATFQKATVDTTLASGGKFVYVPDGGAGQESGMASIPFHIKETGNYVIWARCIYPNSSSNSFWVSMDSGTESLWDVGQRTEFSSAWKWDQVSNRNPFSDPLVFSLTQGQHTVFIREGKDGPQIDQIVITKENSGFIPVDPVIAGGTFTDINGEASANLTLGTTQGTNTVQVSFGSLPPLVFTATATSDTADSITLSSGNNQTGSAGQVLAAPFAVLVQGKLGPPVVGHDVTFSVTGGGGNFSGDQQVTVQTNSSGIAVATLTLGPATGTTNTAEASSSFQGTPLTGSPVSFTASSGVPDKLEAVSSTSLNGTVNLPLPDSVAVRVRDSIGNPLSGFPVDFQVITAGGFQQGKVNGSTNTVTVQTNASGIAKVEWSLGSTAGANNNKLRASAAVPNGSPIEFLAGAQVGSASKLLEISGDSQTGLVQTNLDSAFVVKITDVSDNPVASWPVKFKVVTGGGRLPGFTGHRRGAPSGDPQRRFRRRRAVAAGA